MPNTAVIATLLHYLPVENHKVLSLVSSAFREVFTRRRYLATMNLLVYSHSQLQDIKQHERLLQNVQHLQVLVTSKSVNASEHGNNEQRLTTGHFVIDAICQVTKAARLVSISVARYCAFVRTDFSDQQEPQSDVYRSQLMAIPAENLNALLYLNLLPLGALREAYDVLLSRAPRIETLEFREYTSRWMDPHEDSSWSPTCAPLAVCHLVAIRDHCPRLRRLLGVQVDQNTLAVLETFAAAAIKLTDIYIVHENVAEDRFQSFLSSQPTLLNVHIENTKRHWTPAPVSLFEIANSTLVKLNKLDVFGLPPLHLALQSDEQRVVLSELHTLQKVSIDSWMQYDFSKSCNLRRIRFRGTEPRTWMLNLPWTAMHTLHCLSMSQVAFTDHIVDLLRTACPLLRHLKFKDCHFDTDRCFVGVSRMQLDTLTVVDCRVDHPSRRLTQFSMPQLRRLSIHVDCSDPRQSNALEFIVRSPNLVRLKLYDCSPYNSNVDVTDLVWLMSHAQLRWLTTNVYKRRDSLVSLNVSALPLLERLCIVLRDLDSAVLSVPYEIFGTEKVVGVVDYSDFDALLTFLL